MQLLDWSIPGAEDQPIYGTTHPPDGSHGSPRGVVIIAHGFKGYKDYGMFPRIARCCSDAGLIAHRFNFSHSGMTNEIAKFERPELFERDTWNKQVHDLRAVIEAMAAGVLRGGGLPYVLFGHSRGGVTVLLTAGRFADDVSFPQPAGVITAASPDRCNSLSDTDAQRLLEAGSLDSPSSRTGQTLRIGRAFLQEQLDDPHDHDVLAMTARIYCSMLVIHGESDPTVPAQAAARIVQSARGNAEIMLIPKGDHVFNTPNPFANNERESEQLRSLMDAVLTFTLKVIKR